MNISYKNKSILINKNIMVVARIIDLFCGIGSFHHAAKQHDMKCVFACDIDPNVRKVYQKNYKMIVHGDITDLNIANDIPEHDILCAGFPCQPFSLIGQRKGSDEARGRLIDYIVKILENKQPKACILENVKGLLSINNGLDFQKIVNMIKDTGYTIFHKIMRSDDYGIPQMRQRLFIIGFRNDLIQEQHRFSFPTPMNNPPNLAQYLEMPFIKKSAYTIRCGGRNSGIHDRRNWDSYHMVNGSVYTLTTNDCMKLQGFPIDTWDWLDIAETKKLKMLGNTIPTCLTNVILGAVNYALCPLLEENHVHLLAEIHL